MPAETIQGAATPRFKTVAIHAGQEPDPVYGAVAPPIYQTSTFAFEDVNLPREFDYSRSGNPTRRALEECLAKLEGGLRGFAFATGMAAETTLALLFKPGDHVVVNSDLYGGTYRLFTQVIAQNQVDIEFVDLRDLHALERSIRPNTRGIWIETPTNPCMNLIDLAAVAARARSRNILTVCDNTFLSPYFQRPLEFGIDAVVHSTTKYMNGHSDVVGGAIVVSDPALAEQIGFLQNTLGTCASPFDCFLVLRGIKTLAVRMQEHNRNALALAEFLEQHPKVATVHHPGLPSHPQHDLAKKQMSGYGGTFSFRIDRGEDAVFRFLRALRLFTLAESLGGVESLVDHPSTMTHVSMPEQARQTAGITPDLIRLSVGLEDLADLTADLDQALAAV